MSHLASYICIFQCLDTSLLSKLGLIRQASSGQIPKIFKCINFFCQWITSNIFIDYYTVIYQCYIIELMKHVNKALCYCEKKLYACYIYFSKYI